jgi:2-oxoglutarate ferredoxin oxidoreductase subunit alpha
MIIADGLIGQMMEPVTLPEMKKPHLPNVPWGLTGAKGRRKNVITSVFLGAENLERESLKLQATIARIREKETRYAEYQLEGAEIVVVAYGTAGRIARTAIKKARAAGIPAGLFRPITVAPFPYDRLAEVASAARHVLVVEMSAGQMIEDVRLSIHDAVPVSLLSKLGGVVPMPENILAEIVRLAESPT